MTTLLGRPRILRSGHDSPLTLEQIRSVAPAVFQESASPNMSVQYAYIPTIRILETMLKNGFTVHEVAQARPYKADRDPYAKHMLRLRLPLKVKKVGDIVPELVIVNAHDGTARYFLYGGLYRLVCSNGMMVGNTFSHIVVAHRGGDITRSKVLEGSYEIVEKEFPAIVATHKKMQQVELKPKQQMELAEAALKLRYADLVPTFDAEQLLHIRRPQDEGATLWTIFNRIQENIIEGGFHSRSMLQRLTTVRPVERVDHRVHINRGLWDAAMAYLPKAA